MREKGLLSERLHGKYAIELDIIHKAAVARHISLFGSLKGRWFDRLKSKSLILLPSVLLLNGVIDFHGSIDTIKDCGSVLTLVSKLLSSCPWCAIDQKRFRLLFFGRRILKPNISHSSTVLCPYCVFLGKSKSFK